ncbi:heparinase [Salegentibacter sp. BLCTC]|uniref:alginate lyase family protein n=1 Tax=Salegentibacter sp. BLCTC TaxID=2697368 RepID=UPI00187B8F6F|nr:alginate lyase family protein [Salegentibacter sp. BLCTC]MBE7640566.1 heparinase [Salegentibacter sp. BLCTC]
MKKNIILSYLFICSVLATQAQEDSFLLNNFNLSYPGMDQVKEVIVEDKNKAKKALLDYFKQKDNLYLKLSSNDADRIRQEFPKEVERSIATAEEVREKYFLFRYPWDMEKTNIPYQFENEIDWQANPFGDPEWTFMLNRGRYWQDLGKAYLLTGKEKYAKTFVQQVSDWIDSNPLSKETKATSWRRIDTGIRAENWIKSFEYFKGSKSITPGFFWKFMNSLVQHAEYLNEGFSKFSQTSNWGVLEFQGLYHIALFMPEFTKADKWKEDAVQNLLVTARNQILKDGTQWEQSPMYHNEVFHSFMNVVLLSQRTNTNLPKTIVKKTKDMAYANLEWQKPNYHQPLLGDSDDTDLRDLLTTAGIIFMDPVIKSRAFPIADYENEFLFDIESKKAYKELNKQVPEFLSIFQESSGDLYSRSSWQEDAFYSSFHLKRLGGGHSHDNLLHFSLFAFGRDYLVDPGRFTYVNNKWREYFKDSRSHNTLAVDGKPNSVYGTSWGNKFDAKQEGVLAITEKEFDYAEAINTAYQRLDDPVDVKRRMLYLKPDVWLLIDSFKGKETHTYSQFFNFPNKRISLNGNSVSTTYPDNNLMIQPINPVDISLKEAWISPEYNLKEESLKAEFSIEKTGFNSFITLLYFPENTKVKFEKVPVYDVMNTLRPDEEVEAVKLRFNSKEYILVVAHKKAPVLTTFFYVEGQAIMGEVALIEIKNNEKEIHILK